MGEAVLRTDRLTRRFGATVAVDRLSMEVREGEVFGLLGPNGAGKTTTIRLICGLLRADAGAIWFRGERVGADDDRYRARVGVCPQDIVVWARLTCREQLRFIGQMYGLAAADAGRRGDRLLEELALAERADQQARTLSGGMQRRLNLALALVHDPELVVLDEPEAGLDPQSRVRVREFIRSLARRKTVILTTHNMDEAERMADRVAIVDRGRLLVADTPEALRRSAGDGEVIELRLAAVDGGTADGGSAVGGPAAGDDRDGLVAALGEHAGEVTLAPDGRALTLRVADGVAVLPRVLEVLAARGLRAGDVRVRGGTLEDVFLRLTGRRLRE